MSDDQFDVIVVGAGAAGLACAGEAVLQGLRPLLVCETEEVASVLRSTFVDGNRGIMQAPTWGVLWGNGWIWPLVQALNVPVRYFPELGIELSVWGDGPGPVHPIPKCPSASALTQVLAEFSPWPIGDVWEDFERVTAAGLAIPYEELCKMDRISTVEWLENQGANEMVTYIYLMIGAQMMEITLEETREHVSILGTLSYLRAFLCGDVILPVAYPDAREGLAIPIAKEVERRGGEVWRGRKVAKVIIENDRACGVVFQDGTEVRGRNVALATATKRLSSLLDPLPPELEAPVAYCGKTATQDFTMYTLLDKPVLRNDRNYLGVLDTMGNNLIFSWPCHIMAPWGVEPGKQLLGSQVVMSTKKVPDLVGGTEGVYEKMHDINEAYYPGYREATCGVATVEHKFNWIDSCLTGPKVPRSVDSVEGLWMVGDGSVPNWGLPGTIDGAACAGMLGARAIAKR